MSLPMSRELGLDDHHQGLFQFCDYAVFHWLMLCSGLGCLGCWELPKAFSKKLEIPGLIFFQFLLVLSKKRATGSWREEEGHEIIVSSHTGSK